MTQSIELMNATDLRVSTPMKLNGFKELLQTHAEKQFRLMLPGENAVPVSFHVTEVADVQKRFIDCGGKLHTIHTCQLQAWVGMDTEHRLMAGKMADVLSLAARRGVLTEGLDLDIEIEYEDVTISQYPVTGFTVTDDAVTLRLSHRHTDCLAKDRCLPQLPMLKGANSTVCCGSSCDC